jgi:hypothetical protein
MCSGIVLIFVVLAGVKRDGRSEGEPAACGRCRVQVPAEALHPDAKPGETPS